MWQREIINVPSLGPKDVLVYVMATGINYNNVWAALGYPIDVIAIRQKKENLRIFMPEVQMLLEVSGL